MNEIEKLGEACDGDEGVRITQYGHIIGMDLNIQDRTLQISIDGHELELTYLEAGKLAAALQAAAVDGLVWDARRGK